MHFLPGGEKIEVPLRPATAGGAYPRRIKLFESLLSHQINEGGIKPPSFIWCERWDSNPHGETTRTSNVLVYHSNTLASAIVL